MELATSPVEVVINEVNSEALATMGAEADEQWGKKPAEPEKGDKDWNEKKAADAAKAAAKAGKKAGKVDLTPLPEGTEGATIVQGGKRVVAAAPTTTPPR